jgi:hypothetical protein
MNSTKIINELENVIMNKYVNKFINKISTKYNINEDQLMDIWKNDIKNEVDITYTNTIITVEQYENDIQKETGSLLFSGKYHNMLSYMDMKFLRKKFGLRKNQTIEAVIVMTDDHIDFKNVANLDLPLKYAVFCDKDSVGAEWSPNGYYTHKHPVGDAFIVVNKL